MNLNDYLAVANVRAFLRTIRAGESSQDDEAYTIQYGGKHFQAPPWRHPDERITANGYTSTAAGAYQFLSSTWNDLAQKWDLSDFSPGNQDKGAVALLLQCGAMQHVLKGEFTLACVKAGKVWASLPGSEYGQPTMDIGKAESVYQKYGGTLTPAQTGLETPSTVPTYEAKKMPAPLLLALAPMIAELIPQVAKLFSSGSEVATRNVAAVEAVSNAVVKATNSANIVEAIDRMQRDPELTDQVRQAVVTDPAIIGLLEIGGGIAAARAASADPNQLPFWKQPAFVVTVLLMPLIYIVVTAVVYNIGGTWSDEMRSVVVTAIVSGLLFGITGFYLGTSYSSQKKTDAAIARGVA